MTYKEFIACSHESWIYEIDFFHKIRQLFRSTLNEFASKNQNKSKKMLIKLLFWPKKDIFFSQKKFGRFPKSDHDWVKRNMKIRNFKKSKKL